MQPKETPQYSIEKKGETEFVTQKDKEKALARIRTRAFSIKILRGLSKIIFTHFL